MTPAERAAWAYVVDAPHDADVATLDAFTRAWQSAHMLAVDGIVGPATRAAAGQAWHDGLWIAPLHASIHVFARRFLEACRAEEGVDVVICQGLRTMREQGDLFARGRTLPGPIVTNAPPGSSWHNFGLAFDVAVRIDGWPTWPADVALWTRIGAVGEDLGLEWGGRLPLRDYDHFQRRGGLTLAQARRGLRPAV